MELGSAGLLELKGYGNVVARIHQANYLVERIQHIEGGKRRRITITTPPLKKVAETRQKAPDVQIGLVRGVYGEDGILREHGVAAADAQRRALRKVDNRLVGRLAAKPALLHVDVGTDGAEKRAQVGRTLQEVVVLVKDERFVADGDIGTFLKKEVRVVVGQVLASTHLRGDQLPSGARRCLIARRSDNVVVGRPAGDVVVEGLRVVLVLHGHVDPRPAEVVGIIQSAGKSYRAQRQSRLHRLGIRARLSWLQA